MWVPHCPLATSLAPVPLPLPVLAVGSRQQTEAQTRRGDNKTMIMMMWRIEVTKLLYSQLRDSGHFALRSTETGLVKAGAGVGARVGDK